MGLLSGREASHLRAEAVLAFSYLTQPELTSHYELGLANPCPVYRTPVRSGPSPLSEGHRSARRQSALSVDGGGRQANTRAH
jgi:hypothetical protein